MTLPRGKAGRRCGSGWNHRRGSKQWERAELVSRVLPSTDQAFRRGRSNAPAISVKRRA